MRNRSRPCFTGFSLTWGSKCPWRWRTWRKTTLLRIWILARLIHHSKHQMLPRVKDSRFLMLLLVSWSWKMQKLTLRGRQWSRIQCHSPSLERWKLWTLGNHLRQTWNRSGLWMLSRSSTHEGHLSFRERWTHRGSELKIEWTRRSSLLGLPLHMWSVGTRFH